MQIAYREGAHRNEPTSLAVGDALRANPNLNVSILKANEVSGTQRFADWDTDLTTRDASQPHQMHPGSHLYEARNAEEQWRICNNYPLTLAPHDTKGYPYSEPYACIGGRTHPDILRVISFLGIRTVVLADFAFTKECLRGLCTETYSPPPSDDNYPAFMAEQQQWWLQKIVELADYPSMRDLPPAHDLHFFQFYRAFGVEEATSLALDDFSVEEPFQAMSPELSGRLGVANQLYAMNWNCRNSSDEKIFGALALRVSDYAYDPALQ